MPNTLAHIGAQGLATRRIIKDADLKWIYVGCFLPDVAWIFNRTVNYFSSDVNPFDLRIYSMVQSTLFFSLILSVALAMLSKHFLKTFLILGLNSLLHLLLDACQIKWGNGVHLLAPFNWQLTNFGLFWPESGLTYALTALGLLYMMKNWRKCVLSPLDLSLKPYRIFSFIILTGFFFTLPFLFFHGPEQANNHYIATLRNHENRIGRFIEFDRDRYVPGDSVNVIRTFSYEEFKVENINISDSVTISARGIFTAEDRIQVQDYHVHNGLNRNYPSYLGLILVAITWITSFVRHFRN